jgi:predicted helicase
MTAHIATYLQALKQELARGDSTEHTHRPALKSLIEASLSGLHATNEPSAVERENKPDYIIRRDSTIVGFVEAKDVDKSLKATLKTPQLKRYLEALPNLILTNYADFIWFVGGQRRMEISLCQIKNGQVTPAADAADRWKELIASFVTEVTPTVSTPAQLARTLAGQTRLLRDLSAELLAAKDLDLMEQEASFRALLVPDLKPEEFADMYAQTAAYGLFTARVFEHTTLFGAPAEKLPDSLKNDVFNLEKAAYLIPKANPFLRQFFQHIASPNLNSQMRWLVEQVADSLAHTDIAKVLHRQSRKQGFEDPVFHFYETFLSEYDAKLREARGVYYTPEPVVDYIVRSVDGLLTERFGKAEGLADPTALVLDPATGTATFLRKVIDTIYRRVSSQGMGGAWPMYVRERLLPRVFGFELMMAPYTVAHLKLALQLQEHGFQFAPEERLHVYLTNTLDQLHHQTAAMLGQWIAKENEGAERIKLNAPVEVVLGNPPYSGESRNKSKWILNLLKPYKTEPEGGPLKERNSKWLNDDYVKFIRFAHDRVTRTGHGIVAFITNHSWLDNPTFRGMRARLMADFDDIYVLDLHGSSKKKESTPASMSALGDDRNVFDIEQGVSIVFLIKTLPSQEGGSVPSEASHRKLAGGLVTLKARVHQADLWGSRESKYAWLEGHSLVNTPWQKLEPALPQLLFVPRDETDTEEYEKGWKVTDIFPVNSVGIVTARDRLTIKFTKEDVLSTVTTFEAMPVEGAREHFSLGKDVRDWSVAGAQKDLRSSGLSSSHIVPVTYRPFDTRFTYYTGKSKGFHCMPRGQVMRHLLPREDFENVGLITSRLTKGEQFAHAQVTDKISEVICMSPQTSNNGFLFPLWLLPSKLQADTPAAAQRQANLSGTFLSAVGVALGRPLDSQGMPEGVLPEDVLRYVYAVLHAPSYRSRYAQYLKGDFPRIPLPALVAGPDVADPAAAATPTVVWDRLTAIGADLIALHLLRNVPIELQPTFRMPGDNIVVTPVYEPPHSANNPTDRGRVWINSRQYFDGVPAETWQQKVGGYSVCEKWLKDRRGRELKYTDIEHYSAVVGALTRTRQLMREIDAVADGTLWPATTK